MNKIGKNYISCEIKGGLGNQLFQIATTHIFGLQYGLEPIIKKIDCSPSAFDSRPVYWDSIFHKIQTCPVNEFKKINFNRINETSLRFNHFELSSDKSYFLDGYFQSPKYFNQNRDKILDLFQLDEINSNLVEKYYEKLQNEVNNSNKIISLHVRRGDYIALKYFHFNLDINYYIKATEYFENDVLFLIFSDDINWCKENFNFINNKYFVEGLSDVQELILMSKCDGHIIANSSFSWWGAWLNPKVNKKIVAPRSWFVFSEQNDAIMDIYEEDWYVINLNISETPVSVIIPLYNGIDFLPEAIESVKKQSYPNWEILIGVNGHQEGSNCYQIASKFNSKKIIVKEYMSNDFCGALNSIVKDCKYDTICLLDVDDKWDKYKLEKQIKMWDKRLYDIIGTNTKYFGDLNIIPNLPIGEIPKNIFLQYNPIVNSSVMFKKSDAYWNNNYLNDYDMWLRLNNEGKRFYNLDEILTYHRIHKNSMFNNINDQYVSQLLSDWSKIYNNSISVTIVTAFFTTPNKYNHSIYMNWIPNLLNIPENMFIYCDSTAYSYINTFRPKNLSNRTHWLICDLDDLNTSKFNYWNEQYNKDPEKHFPNLYKIWNSKTEMVYNATKINPFNSNWFYWCDIGYIRESFDSNKLLEKGWISNKKIFNEILNQNSVTFLSVGVINNNDSNLLNDGLPRPFNLECHLGGGIFIGKKQAIEIFYKEYYQLVDKMEKAGRFVGKDQDIYYTLYLMQPDLIDILIPGSLSSEWQNLDYWFLMIPFIAGKMKNGKFIRNGQLLDWHLN